MTFLQKQPASASGESVQVLQDELDHAQLAPNQNQILPDQSHHNPLRQQAEQQGQDALKKPAPLDEVALKDVPLDESKLDPQERQVNQTQKYAPGPDHASPAQQNQDQLELEKHTANEQVEERQKMERAEKNPQVPRNQQHQSPGSEPLNQVKQQQGIETLIDNT